MNHFKIRNLLLKFIPLKGVLQKSFGVSNYFSVILLLAFVTLPKLNFSNSSAVSHNSAAPTAYTNFPNTEVIHYTHLSGKIKDTEQHFDVAISPFEIEEDEDTLQHKKHPTAAGSPYCASFTQPVNLHNAVNRVNCANGKGVTVRTGAELIISNCNFRI